MIKLRKLRSVRAVPTLYVAVWLAALLSGCGDGVASEPEALTSSQVRDPESCRGCHPAHYAEWSSSMHAYAAQDPVFVAMNRRGQRETSGELGDFCLNCHAPQWREGGLLDLANLADLPPDLAGVTCYSCHGVEGVDALHNNGLRLNGGTRLFGRIREPKSTRAHAGGYSSLLAGAEAESSALCGSCHDVRLPSPPAAAVVNLERTYEEWASSVFAPAHAPTTSAVATCGSCHLPAVGDDEPIAVGGPQRVRHSHLMPGIDRPLFDFPRSGNADENASLQAQQAAALQRLLDSSLRIEICVQELVGDASAVYLTLDNASVGHNFPSGAAHNRRMWAEVMAYRDGQLLYESGVETGSTPLVASADPDLWLFRDRALDQAGEETPFFWKIASYEADTVPVPRTADPSDPDFYLSHVGRRFPRDAATSIAGVPDRVSVRMRIQAIGVEVFEELIGSGDLDPAFSGSSPLDVLPNRHLAAAAPELSTLDGVSMEWSAATLASPAFSRREDATSVPARLCVAMPRSGR